MPNPLITNPISDSDLYIKCIILNKITDRLDKIWDVRGNLGGS